jgi:Na+/melibiose symporter-like transporter
MCNWQKISTPERCDGYYRNYSMAWNLGLLVGYLLGAVLVLFLGSDFLVIVIAWVCACLMIPTAYLIENRDTPLTFIDNCAVIIIGRASAVPLDIHSYRSTPIDKGIYNYGEITEEQTQKSSSSTNGNHLLSSFSFTLVVFAALSFSILKSFYTFVFPYFLEMQALSSYWVYIVIFFQQFIQFILIRWLSNRSLKNRWNIFLIGFVLGWSFTFLFFIAPSLWFITVITIIIGAVHAMLYTLSTQIMLDKGTKTGSSKYANHYEAIIGAGFGITPIMAGYIVEFNILLNFPIIGLLIFICFTICYVLGKRVFAYNKI